MSVPGVASEPSRHFSAHRVDRFPHALKNSCVKLRRSRLHFLHGLSCVELSSRQIAHDQVQAFLLWTFSINSRMIQAILHGPLYPQFLL